MRAEDKMEIYYSKARELIKQNNPKEARKRVLDILNDALISYDQAQTILKKAQMAAFLDRWIAVSRDLYDKGITDYVLECFQLPPRPEEQLTTKKNPQKKTDRKIDIEGLVEKKTTSLDWKADVFKNNKKAVVEITISMEDHQIIGTGFIISKKGYILTNDHIVYNESTGNYFSNIKMTMIGDKKPIKLTVLFSDKQSDVALCSFNPTDVKESFSIVRRIKDYSKIAQGSECVIIGNALGTGLAPFPGTIRFPKTDQGNLVFMANANQGDSGGPVFNSEGECIAINKSRMIAFQGIEVTGFNNATPMDQIEQLLKKWAVQ